MRLTYCVILSNIVVMAVVGCRSEAGPELIPVVGQVIIDGKPANEGVVTFRHEPSGAFEASGIIRGDGTYVLMQNDRQGAQSGAYRVVVFVRKTPRTPNGEMAGLPSIIVNRKFTSPDTTPLRVDVRKDAAVGGYDLIVTR